jgi:carbon storage regulator
LLILTRKLGETIAIGDEIKITFLDMKGNQLRIGVEAPRNIPVHRGEIYRLIKEQNMRAAAIDPALPDIWEKLASGEGL